MVFSSLTFIFSFLPFALMLYYLTPARYRNLTLFALSLVFYAWGEPRYVVLMLYSTVLDYTCGRMIERHRQSGRARYWLWASLAGNIGLLGVFKYSDWLLGSCNQLLGTALPLPGLRLPIGISFYTFQTMSYTIDVYRQTATAERSIIRFGAFVTLFPQLIAGPIVRYADVARELAQRQLSWDGLGQGVRYFIIGLAKKVLLANNCGLIFTQITARQSGGLTLMGAWLGIVAYSFQIYFDFSGYSDMAVGLGRMLGFTFPQNFNYPFIAASITEFWRRWHITLGSWFRDYVYIPLGGNRRGAGMTYRNIAVVWLLTGLWHGAAWNFLWWGAYFAAVLMLERWCLLRHLQSAPRWLRHVYTLMLVFLSFVIFALPTGAEISAYTGALFGLGGRGLIVAADRYLLSSNLLLLLVVFLAATPLPRQLAGRLLKALSTRQRVWLAECAAPAILMGLLVTCTAYLVDASYNPFLYFRF